MIPQERDLLSSLINRLKQAPPPEKDAEADAMIGDLARERPDAPYVLAQCVGAVLASAIEEATGFPITEMPLSPLKLYELSMLKK